MWQRTFNPVVRRKLVFMERELEILSSIIDELVDCEGIYEDDARDIRDSIINMELQTADLQELNNGPQVTRQRQAG